MELMLLESLLLNSASRRIFNPTDGLDFFFRGQEPGRRRVVGICHPSESREQKRYSAGGNHKELPRADADLAEKQAIRDEAGKHGRADAQDIEEGLDLVDLLLREEHVHGDLQSRNHGRFNESEEEP